MAALEEFWGLDGDSCPVRAANSPFNSENVTRMDRQRGCFTAGSLSELVGTLRHLKSVAEGRRVFNSRNRKSPDLGYVRTGPCSISMWAKIPYAKQLSKLFFAPYSPPVLQERTIEQAKLFPFASVIVMFATSTAWMQVVTDRSAHDRYNDTERSLD